MPNLMLQDWFEMFNSLELNLIASGDFVAPKSKELTPVAEAFCANCNRVFFAQRFPKFAFDAGRLFQVAESIASEHLEKDPYKYAKQYCAKPSKNVKDLRNEFLSLEKPTPFVVAAMTEHADLLAASSRHDLTKDIELLMSMQIMSAWAIFETLLGDLLISAIYSGPRIRLDANGKPLDVEKFYAARFLGKQGICQTYLQAFHDDGTDIIDTVSDKSLLAVFAVRNLIAHKAGRCDSKYCEHAKEVPQIPQLKVGEQLHIDGWIIRTLVPPAFYCCVRLIQQIDIWLATHPY